MSENIDYKISADTSKAVANTNQLTAANVELSEQLKIAKKNLLESVNAGGAYTKASKEAATDVNTLTEQIKSNNATIRENSKTTKDATATQGFFEKTMRSVTGNSTAYERAMKSMGVSVGISDGLTKLIMFSTIAYDQAITAITIKKEAETVAEEVNTVAKAENVVATTAATGATGALSTGITIAEIATWGWNAALAVLLAPITALVAIVATVATGVYFLVDALDTNEAAQKRLNKAVLEGIAIHERDIQQRKELQKAYDHNNEMSLKLSEAKGVEGEALEKLSLKLKANEIAMAMANAETQKGIFLSARKAVLDAKEAGADEDEIKKLKSTYDKEYKAFTDFNELVKVKSQEYRDIKTNADIEQAKKETKEREKKPEKDKEDKRKEIKSVDFLGGSVTVTDELLGIYNDRNEKELELDRKKWEEKAKIDKYGYDNALNEAIRNTAELEALYELDAKNAENLTDAKINFAMVLSSGLSQIAGKNKALAIGMMIVEKGLAVGQVIVSASRAIASAVANLASTPAIIGVVPNPAYAVQAAATAKGILTTKISAAASIASIVASGINSASSINSGNLGGDGTNGGGGQSSVTPQIGFQNSPENQIAKTITTAQNQQNIKVTLLASDVTDMQDDIKTDVVNNSF